MNWLKLTFYLCVLLISCHSWAVVGQSEEESVPPEQTVDLWNSKIASKARNNDASGIVDQMFRRPVMPSFSFNPLQSVSHNIGYNLGRTIGRNPQADASKVVLVLANDTPETAALPQPNEETLKRLVRNPDFFHDFVAKMASINEQLSQQVPAITRTVGQGFDEVLAQEPLLGQAHRAIDYARLGQTFGESILPQRMFAGVGDALNISMAQNETSAAPQLSETERVENELAPDQGDTSRARSETPAVPRSPFDTMFRSFQQLVPTPPPGSDRNLFMFNPGQAWPWLPQNPSPEGAASDISEVRVKPEGPPPYKITPKEGVSQKMNEMKLKAAMKDALTKKTIPILWFRLPDNNDQHNSHNSETLEKLSANTAEDLKMQMKLEAFEKQLILELQQLQEVVKLANAMKRAQLETKGKKSEPSQGMTPLALSNTPIYKITLDDIERTLKDEYVQKLLQMISNSHKKEQQQQKSKAKYSTDITGNPNKRQTSMTGGTMSANLNKDDLMKMMAYAYRMAASNGQEMSWLKETNAETPSKATQTATLQQPDQRRRMEQQSDTLNSEQQWMMDKQKEMSMGANKERDMTDERKHEDLHHGGQHFGNFGHRPPFGHQPHFGQPQHFGHHHHIGRSDDQNMQMMANDGQQQMRQGSSMTNGGEQFGSMTTDQNMRQGSTMSNSGSMTPDQNMRQGSSMTNSGSMTPDQNMRQGSSMTNSGSMTPDQNMRQGSSMTPDQNMREGSSMTPDQNMRQGSSMAHGGGQFGAMTPDQNMRQGSSMTNSGLMTSDQNMRQGSSMTNGGSMTPDQNMRQGSSMANSGSMTQDQNMRQGSSMPLDQNMRQGSTMTSGGSMTPDQNMRQGSSMTNGGSMTPDPTMRQGSSMTNGGEQFGAMTPDQNMRQSAWFTNGGDPMMIMRQGSSLTNGGEQMATLPQDQKMRQGSSMTNPEQQQFQNKPESFQTPMATMAEQREWFEPNAQMKQPMQQQAFGGPEGQMQRFMPNSAEGGQQNMRQMNMAQPPTMANTNTNSNPNMQMRQQQWGLMGEGQSDNKPGDQTLTSGSNAGMAMSMQQRQMLPQHMGQSANPTEQFDPQMQMPVQMGNPTNERQMANNLKMSMSDQQQRQMSQMAEQAQPQMENNAGQQGQQFDTAPLERQSGKQAEHQTEQQPMTTGNERQMANHDPCMSIGGVATPQMPENAGKARHKGMDDLLDDLLGHPHHDKKKKDKGNAPVINYYYNSGGSRYPPVYAPAPPPSYGYPSYGGYGGSYAPQPKYKPSAYYGGGYGSNAYGSHGGYRTATGDAEIEEMLKEHQTMPKLMLLTRPDDNQLNDQGLRRTASLDNADVKNQTKSNQTSDTSESSSNSVTESLPSSTLPSASASISTTTSSPPSASASVDATQTSEHERSLFSFDPKILQPFMGLQKVDRKDDPWHHKPYDLYQPIFTGGGTFESLLNRYRRNVSSNPTYNTSPPSTQLKHVLTPGMLERLLRIKMNFEKNYPFLYKTMMGHLMGDKHTSLSITPPEIPEHVSYPNVELAAAEIDQLEVLLNQLKREKSQQQEQQREEQQQQVYHQQLPSSQESYEPLINSYDEEKSFWEDMQPQPVKETPPTPEDDDSFWEQFQDSVESPSALRKRESFWTALEAAEERQSQQRDRQIAVDLDRIFNFDEDLD